MVPYNMLKPALLTFVLLCATAPIVAAEKRYFVLASTTSTEQSGLFGHLVPQFREATGFDVRVIAVGTGQAFEIARRGDADALLVHDRDGEHAFVRNGYGVDRRDVMHNDFVIVGPADDPAGIAHAGGAADALAAIARAGAPFASRGDDSGTHRMELHLWKTAGADPTAGRRAWYRELGSGMGPTLNTAVAMDAYTLTDRATWANFHNRQNLVLLLEGDPALHNPYGSILVNPERHPHVRAEAAHAWHEWLTSTEGQAAIRAFRVGGNPVFFVD